MGTPRCAIFLCLGNLETSLTQVTWYQFLAAISSKSVNSMKFRGLLFVVSETMCSSNHLQYEDF